MPKQLNITTPDGPDVRPLDIETSEPERKDETSEPDPLSPHNNTPTSSRVTASDGLPDKFESDDDDGGLIVDEVDNAGSLCGPRPLVWATERIEGIHPPGAGYTFGQGLGYNGTPHIFIVPQGRSTVPARFDLLSEETNLPQIPKQDWPTRVVPFKAQFQNNLTAPFSQGKELNNLLLRQVFGRPRGVCVTLVVDWLVNRHGGGRTILDTHWVSRISELWKAAKTQSKYRKGHRGKVNLTIDQVLELIGHERVKTTPSFVLLQLQSSQQKVADAVWHMLVGRENVRCILELFGDGRAHAVSIFGDTEGFHVFDPNLGEYHFGDAEQGARFCAELWDVYCRCMGFYNIRGTYLDLV